VADQYVVTVFEPTNVPPAGPAPSKSHARVVAGVVALVIVGLAIGAVFARANSTGTAFAYGGASGLDPSNGISAPNLSTHWHAALGVYACDEWLGSDGHPGIWYWPAHTPSGEPALAADPSRYAGLHSHGDGLIHIEPGGPAEEGRNATLGLYFREGGWKISQRGFTFLSTRVQNGDECDGAPGKLRWYVNGTQYTGDPADYRIADGDVIVVAFTSDGAYPGDAPSAQFLPGVRHP
jgi:hypothetical protein